MSGNQNRTVTLTLDAQTTGLDGVKALATELKKLSKEGGDAAPEFERLSKELTGLAEQKTVAAAFTEISDSVTAAKASLDGARQSAKQQSEALDELKLSTEGTVTAFVEQSAAMKRARTDVQQANVGLLQARAAVREYESSIGGANSATREQTATLKTLRQAVLDAKAELANAKVAVASLVPEYEKLKSENDQVTAGIRQQERTLKNANAEVEKAKSQFDQLQTELQVVSTAMQKLGLDTNDVAGAQNKLTQSMARLTQEADQLKAKLSAPGATAASAGERIEQAFGVVGVKSVNAIKAEILKVNSALMSLAQNANVSGADFDRAFTAGKQKIKELEAQLKQADNTTKSFTGNLGEAFRQFGPATLVFNGITAGIGALTAAAAKIPKVTAEFQTMNRVLTVITGSTAAAAKEFQYIKDVANRVGSDIKSVGDSYIRLAAATKDTALEGAQTKRVFEAVAGSMGMLGASSAETQHALMAVTQMVSKGVVSMEEMRQQLGERLPGAFQVTAKELGITTSDLNDLISSGNLTADQMLPALARGLENLYKSGSQNDTLVGQWAQFTNALKESANAIGDSGLVAALLKAARVGTATATVMVEGFIQVGKSIGILSAALVTGNFKDAFEEIAEGFRKVDERAGRIAGRGSEVKLSLADMAKEAKAAGQEFVTMSDGTKVAVAAIEGLSTGMVKFMIESAQAEKRAEGFATSARKAAEYTRSAGEAAITSANAIGDETEKRLTATRVAENNTAALSKLLDAERAVLDIQQQRMLRLVEEVAAKGQASDADQKIIRDLEKEVIERKTVVEGITAQVEAQRVLGESLRLHGELLKDNSGQVEALRLVNTQYQEALRLTREEIAAGTATQEQANALEEEARKVKARYIDALNDQQEKLKALNTQKQSQFDVDRMAINLSIEQQKTIYEVAKARGDEYGAAQALIQIKRLEIELAALTAKAKRAEAEATMALVAADREELVAKGQLTEAKAAELRAREIGAQVKMKEAEVSDELARRLRQLANTTQAASNAAGSSAGGYEKLADSMNKAADAASRLHSAQGGVGGNGAGMDGQYGSTGSGSVIDDPTFDHDTFNSGGHSASRTVDLKDMLYKQGATVEEADKASKYMGELMRRMVQAGSTSVRTTEDNVRLINQSAKDAAVEAIRLAKLELAGATVDIGPSTADLQQRNLAQLTNRDFGLNSETAFNAMREAIAAAGREGRDRPAQVTITLNGKKQTLGMNSIRDANNLAVLLDQLQSDKGRV